MIRFLLLFLSSSMIAGATPWSTTPLNYGNETGAVSAVAVDSAGRVHAVYSVRRPGSLGVVHNLVYQMRSNGSSGFTPTDEGTATFDTRPTDSPPLHVSIDVTDDFTVQIAMVDTAGVVRVYEKLNPSSPTWSTTVVSTLASTDGDGGVSLRSRGDNESGSSALTFTKDIGGDSGGVQFSEQESDGSWRTPIDIFTGVGTGISPVLVNTGFRFGPRMVISYNATANRIQAAAYAARAPDFTYSWRAPVEVAPASTATRLDAEAKDALIGVAFVTNDTAHGESEVRVHYASDRLDGLGSWEVSDVASPSDVDPSGLVGFGPNVALAFDAECNPWVCYTHDVGIGFDRHTAEVHARRLLLGIGWEDSLVDSIPQTGTTLGLTDSLSLATGDNGDPALLYEREKRDGLSSPTFARPVAAPWQLNPTLNPGVERSQAAFTASSDGSLHLATVKSGGLFGFRVTTFSGDSETVDGVESPGFFPFIGMTSTPDGALHVVAVRTVASADTTGLLLYFRRPSGGTFSPPSIVGGSMSTVEVESSPIVLRSDQAGALYLLCNSTESGLRLLKSSGPGALWIDQFPPGLVDPTSCTDLAVRAGGGYAFATCTDDGSSFTLWSNIDPVSGALIEELESHEWLLPESVSAITCMILPDGRPAGAWVDDGIIHFTYPKPDGAFEAAILTSSGTFQNPAIALRNVAGEIRLFVYSSADGGTLSDLQVTPIFEPNFRYKYQVRTLFQPQLNLAAATSQAFSVAIDSSGFPAIAMTSISLPLIPSEIYLARPADALDPDGDNIPLLLEGAHCLDFSSPDPRTLLPTGQASSSAGGVVLSYFFRSHSVKGEYVYRYEASQDLQNWFEEVDVAGGIDVSAQIPTPIPDRPGCWSNGVLSRYFGNFLDANEQRFTRLKILRDR